MVSTELLARDWHRSLRELVGGAKERLLLCSPFVGRVGTQLVIDNVAANFVESGSITLLTNLSVANMCQMSTDPRALKSVADAIPNSTIFHLPGLHAKVFIADETRAIVTSGNLTAGGLYRNFEYGVDVVDPSMVRRIHTDLVEFASLGVSVPQPRLSAYCDAVNDLFESIDEAQRTAQQAIRQRFKRILAPIEDDLLRLRLSGGPLHTVFAKTVRYLLLTHGPLTTIQIHPMISAIHPDLCDDSVDRVIDGKHFGKKWKHAVRTAQQQLKQKGEIVYELGRWRLE